MLVIPLENMETPQQAKVFFALPRHVMDLQLSTLDLLTAMFPSANELDISSSTMSCISQLRDWIADPKALPSGVPAHLSLGVRVEISAPDEMDTVQGEPHRRPDETMVQLNLQVPLQSDDPEPTDPPPWTYSIRQPSWMTKTEVAELGEDMPADDVFAAIDHLRDTAPRFLASSPSALGAASAAVAAAAAAASGPLLRVWFYFPSLSTRAKRDDLVNHAPHYRLTGFVLAGKPGVLCLEGTSEDVDAYMKFIKTESWGDIPSHQKKVSERWRQGGVGGESVGRVFDGMQEITDLLGERRGERANRGDMKALEAWLKEKGLGEAFEKVIF